MITVTRERYPANQDEQEQVYQCATVTHPTYASVSGRALLEIREAPDSSQMWRSEDNGRNWALAAELATEERNADGTFAQRAFAPLVLDPDHDLLIRFQREHLLRVPRAQARGYQSFVTALIPDSYRVFYQISRDAGRTWDPRRQLIESGAEYDAAHWAKNITHLESSIVLGEPPPFHKLPDGRIVIPAQVRTDIEAGTYGTIQAGRLYGRWRADLSDLDWQSGGRVFGGGCEQTTAVLKDGRILNIMRVQGQIQPYLFDVWLRPYTVSEDGGDTWSRPEPLQYTDGTGLTSPRAWSQLLRSARNGKLYWIANILPAYEDTASIREQYPARADPRYPLQIVEVDEDQLALKRDTLTVIEDRAPGETHWVRFSNFFVYNDRETQDIVLLMQKSYCELQEDLDQQPHPSYRYRIRVA